MEDQKSKATPPQGDGIPTDTIPSFLLKTYEILENDKYSDIICWTKNGEGFIVKKVKEFSENILPIHFRHSNYTSFVRQLNMYDFHKTRQENHENAFKNLMFKKGYKHMLKEIQRKDYKKNKDGPKQTSPNEKGSLERTHNLNKNDNKMELGKDMTKLGLKQMIDASHCLERKSLSLAQMKEIPKKQNELVKLLDVLFEAKRVHRDLLEKMSRLNLQGQKQNVAFIPMRWERSCQKLQSKVECPTTAPKQTRFVSSKELHQIGTNVSLFSSFNQI